MILYEDSIYSETLSATTFSADTIYIGGNQISTVNSSFNSLSATTLSASTIYSGNTNLYSIFQTIGSDTDHTHIQNGTNTFTGGTTSNPNINITALTIDNISVSGNSTFNILSATTLFSGSTDLSTYFGNEVTRSNNLFDTKANLSGATFTGQVNVGVLSATTISGSTIISGSTDLNNIFHQKSGYLLQKSGIIPSSGFTGNPKKSTVIFTTAFSDNNYAITVSGEDNRTWSIESKVYSAVTINSNSSALMAGNSFWIAQQIGEGYV